MSTNDIYAEPTIRQPQMQPVQEPTVLLPPTHTPDEVRKWLEDMGWGESVGNNGQLWFSKQGQFDSLYFPWHEAVTLEHLKFMSLGNVGQKRVDNSANMGEASVRMPQTEGHGRQ